MTQIFTETEQVLLNRVREAVHAIEPDAQIILYGFRARGDAEPDSDRALIPESAVHSQRASRARTRPILQRGI